jgi:hypothetical protein
MARELSNFKFRINGKGEDNPDAIITFAILIAVAVAILLLIAFAAKLAAKPERIRNPRPEHALLVLRYPISPQRPYIGDARCLMASMVDWIATVG